MKKTPIQLSDHFTYSRLFRFVLSPIAMMIFTSVYSVVDGLFVSNFVGKTQFAALNLVMPLLFILSAIGFMLGTGGTAIVAKTFGMGDSKLANEYFSILIYVTIGAGAILSAIGIAFARPVSILLGAEGEMLDYCVVYARIILAVLPLFMLQIIFQSFFMTAEKPKLGLLVTVIAGCTNIVLDALLVGVLRLGLEGAALATALSQSVGGIIPLVYFASKNTSTLRLGKTRFYGKMLLHTCVNGSSELMTNISASVVTMLYNFQLLKFAGEDGVAAYGVIMYFAFIFNAIFIGFVIGSSPIISYHYGAENRDELKNMFRKSLTVVSFTALAMVIMSVAFANPLSAVFVGYDPSLFEMTRRGFIIYAAGYLFSGFNIFGSAFFTALNNGVVSAIISFLRTLVFQVICILAFPMFFELDGIWVAGVVAEMLSFSVTASFLVAKRRKYGYA